MHFKKRTETNWLRQLAVAPNFKKFCSIGNECVTVTVNSMEIEQQQFYQYAANFNYMLDWERKNCSLERKLHGGNSCATNNNFKLETNEKVETARKIIAGSGILLDLKTLV